MKLLSITLSFLLLTQFSWGQNRNDTTVTVKYIDSLKRELSDLKQRNNSLYWRYQEKANVHQVDTIFIRPDSSVITFSRKDGTALKKQHNVLDSNKEIKKYTIHYYDDKARVKYIEVWYTLKDDQWDAMLYAAERIEYDSLGRQRLSVTYYQSLRRTIRRTFQYDPNGNIQTNTEVIKSYALWID